MHRYEARISWARNGAAFTDSRYSRAHTWEFDGGVQVPASSSPSVVPLPCSAAEAVDPEEALVASASSCHMLTLLFVAAKRGFVIDSYVDEATGTMEKNAEGRLFISKITLRPRIAFSGEKRPTPEELDSLHHAAHRECYIANSIRAEIVVAAPD